MRGGAIDILQRALSERVLRREGKLGSFRKNMFAGEKTRRNHSLQPRQGRGIHVAGATTPFPI